MMLRARILIIISISSLILYPSVEGFDILLSEPPPGPTPSPTSIWGGISEGLQEAEKNIAPVTSSIINKAQAISSSVSASSLVPSPSSGPAPHADFPSSSSPDSSPSPLLAPTLPSSPGPASSPSEPSSAPGSGLGLAPSPLLGPALSPNQPSSSPESGQGPGPSPSRFIIDHDVALAIESRIKQSQTNAQLAMDEAKKLLKDPKIASSETGVCLSKCVDEYGASLNELNRAIKDLGVRDVTLLTDDFGEVEKDISTCQACFTENVGEDSPFKALEEATTKAARECLNVMDYAA